MADDNRPLKYARYAIGEIVLVVVGILIALYINNWNELRKEHEKFNQVLAEVENELIANIQECREVYETLYRVDSMAIQVLYDSLTIEDYRKVKYLDQFSQIGIQYHNPYVRSDAFKKLTENFSDLSKDQDSIVADLYTLYTERLQLLDKFSDESHSIVMKNLYMYQEFPWYREFLFTKIRNEEMLHFFVNDQRHLNAIALYSEIVLGDARRIFERFEIQSLESYRKIFNYLEKHNLKHNDSLHFEYDAQDYKHYLGVYKIFDVTDKDDVEFLGDSTVISIENDKLYYTTYDKNGNAYKREVIPINKYHFRTIYGLGYYQIVHDSLDEVIGLNISNGQSRIKEKKIR